jgi:hypothetical protein
MEAHHDLRKFITELPVAQRCAVLSSGRDADCGVAPVGVKLHHRKIVGRLTPWAGIESSTAMDSDQTAAEALQVAETEVGVGIERSIGVRTWVARAGGLAYRSADSALDLGLMA